MPEWSGSFVGGAGGDAGGVAGVEAVDAFGDCVCDFWLSKEKTKGHRRLLVHAATAKSRGDYSQSSQKLAKANTNVFFLFLSLK
jgi:hypothetical protein